MRRFQNLGHIFHSRRQDSEDESRSPEEGADPVKPAFEANDAHNQRSQDRNSNKNPELLDSEKVYKGLQRDPDPEKRVWYGKNAKGEWYQHREDGRGNAHCAGAVEKERVPVAIRRGRE